MYFLHITNHSGTTRNIQNVFASLSASLSSSMTLITENCDFPLFISEYHASQIWQNYKSREDFQREKFQALIFTDTSMYARPFLQNIEDHSMIIIMYITNRFDWGAWHGDYGVYLQLYAEVSHHPRVFFLADNRYDQYYASMHHGIHFRNPDIIRLTPIISQNYSGETQEKIIIHNSKLFIYNRGTFARYFEHCLPFSREEYDIFGYDGYSRYTDEYQISEYLGFLHLPYQTNIQSLWENLGHAIIYFIPSKMFLKELVQESWYYWEEKTKYHDSLNISIDLAEWYQPENETCFVFFDSWMDLKEKRDIFLENNSAVFYKKQWNRRLLIESNQIACASWDVLFQDVNHLYSSISKERGEREKMKAEDIVEDESSV